MRLTRNAVAAVAKARKRVNKVTAQKPTVKGRSKLAKLQASVKEKKAYKVIPRCRL